MKNKNIILIISTFLIPLNSCLESLLPVRGNGMIVTETRRSGPFDKVENSTSIDIIYKQADSISISIKADENLQEYIVTETYDNTLEIKTRPGHSFLDFKERPLITITSPNLESAYLTGSGTFVADEMSGDEVILKLSGSGDISVSQIDFTELSVMLTGSGNINVENCQGTASDILLSGSGNAGIKGQSEECHFKITGSGGIFAENYFITSASITISGSGNVFTKVDNALTAIISGSGNIYLRGNPEISKTISGSGRIIKYK